MVGIVVREGRVLALRRAADRDVGAGLWEAISGRVERGEDPLQAVQREIAEETGLQVEIDPRPVDAYAARRGEEPMTVVCYRASWLGGEVSRSDEHDAHDWCTPDELAARGSPARLVEAIRRAVEMSGVAHA